MSRPERETWQAMRSLVLDRYDAKREVCEVLDMSFVRVKALLALAAGPLPMRDLVARLGTDPAYATLVVDDLERRGFAERTPNPTDRRAKIVSSTVEGRRAARKADSILGRPPRSMGRLSSDELAELARMVAVLSS